MEKGQNYKLFLENVKQLVLNDVYVTKIQIKIDNNSPLA